MNDQDWITVGSTLLSLILMVLLALSVRRTRRLMGGEQRLGREVAALREQHRELAASRPDPRALEALRHQLAAAQELSTGQAQQAQRDERLQQDLRRQLSVAQVQRDAAQEEAERLRNRPLPEPPAAPEPPPVLPGTMPPLAAAGASGTAEPMAGQVPAGLDPVPDTEVDAGDQGGLLLRAASVRGARHRRAAVHRKDAFLLRSYDGRFRRPFTLAAVAAGDPAGEWAQIAARRTCLSLADQLGSLAQTVERVVEGDGDEDLLRELLHTVVDGTVESLSHLARSRNAADPSDAATEFIALLSPVGDTDSRRHLVFGVGPCAAIRLRDGEWEVVFTPAPAEASGGAAERSERTVQDTSEALRHGFVETLPGDVLAVCSPAAARLLLDQDAREFLAEQWSDGAPHLAEFLWQMGVHVRGATADRTAVCLWEFGSVAQVRRSGPSRAAQGTY
ncbi:protein phosphatase 2C domain-containing protein [Streptomyces sp. 8N706]|uniref:protein phosphatase 2C domain-containing protein n=1 Tax=Streptomyces sp. 8N706 TaxID=3457416 RepID=UPI003FD215C2